MCGEESAAPKWQCLMPLSEKTKIWFDDDDDDDADGQALEGPAWLLAKVGGEESLYTLEGDVGAALARSFDESRAKMDGLIDGGVEQLLPYTRTDDSTQLAILQLWNRDSGERVRDLSQ